MYNVLYLCNMIHEFKTPKKKIHWPKVDIAIINGRDNKEWLHAAIESVRLQSYPNFNILLFDNYPNKDRIQVSIGKAWNDLVKRSKAPYILFLGDDDYLAHDYLTSLITGFKFLESQGYKPVNITSYCTAISESNQIKGLHPVKVTGMYKRDYLIKNPFNETLKSQVDTDQFKHMEETGALSFSFPHYYGYYYRQHAGQVSKNNPKNEK